MDLQPQFQEFLSNIEPTQAQRDEFMRGHRTLRARLDADESLKPRIITHFLQGSYKRSTAIRPRGGKKSDVDVVVVTNLASAAYDPHTAMNLFVPFLSRHYPGKWEFNGRSIGITLSYVELDLVLTRGHPENGHGRSCDEVKYLRDAADRCALGAARAPLYLT